MSIGFGASQLLIELGRKDKVKSPDLLHKFQIFAEFFTNAVLFYCNYYQEVAWKKSYCFQYCKEHLFVWPLCFGLRKIRVAAQENECFTNPSDEIKTFCLQHSVAKLMDNSLSFLAMSWK